MKTKTLSGFVEQMKVEIKMYFGSTFHEVFIYDKEKSKKGLEMERYENCHFSGKLYDSAINALNRKKNTTKEMAILIATKKKEMETDLKEFFETNVKK